MTQPENAKLEVERGLRVRLAPQGITGTSYLEIDYVDPPPPLLPIDWTPDNVYIPSAPSTVTRSSTRRPTSWTGCTSSTSRARSPTSTSCWSRPTTRIDAIDTKAISRAHDARAGQGRDDARQLAAKKLSDEGVALLAELRATNAELKKTLANPALQKLPDDAARGDRARPRRSSTIRTSPRSLANLRARSRASTASSAAAKPTSRRTIDNLRQITDNLRDLTEDDQALSGERALRRAAAPAGAQAMTMRSPR